MVGRYLYEVEYKDPDPGCPIFTMRLRADNPEHLHLQFFADGDDWEIVRYAVVTERPRHRWNWRAYDAA